MGTSHYFNNFSSTKINEQRLYEDILIESIRIMGHDIYYVAREDFADNDNIFGENVSSRFERAYQMEMYIANAEGWEGDSDFFSKFGLEIREGSNFIVAKKTFEKYVPSMVTRRPKEGDLLFVPVMNKIFEIKFVEEELLFFSHGQRLPYIYELRCEVFRTANEKINTGVERIDEIDDKTSYTIQLTLGGSGNYNIGEAVYQGSNLAYSTASAKVTDWIPTSRIISLIDIKGTFGTGNLIGFSTNTSSAVVNTDLISDHVYYDLFDNKDIQSEANTIVDLSEINIFGTP